MHKAYGTEQQQRLTREAFPQIPGSTTACDLLLRCTSQTDLNRQTFHKLSQHPNKAALQIRKPVGSWSVCTKPYRTVKPSL